MTRPHRFDSDEQAKATDFAALVTEQLGAPGYTAVALSGPAVRTQVFHTRPKYGHIIIDASELGYSLACEPR
jgi:chromosome partitioning protein